MWHFSCKFKFNHVIITKTHNTMIYVSVYFSDQSKGTY